MAARKAISCFFVFLVKMATKVKWSQTLNLAKFCRKVTFLDYFLSKSESISEHLLSESLATLSDLILIN